MVAHVVVSHGGLAFLASLGICGFRHRFAYDSRGITFYAALDSAGTGTASLPAVTLLPSHSSPDTEACTHSAPTLAHHQGASSHRRHLESSPANQAKVQAHQTRWAASTWRILSVMICRAASACWGTTPLPSILSWFARLIPSMLVTWPGLRPIIHSTKTGDS